MIGKSEIDTWAANLTTIVSLGPERLVHSLFRRTCCLLRLDLLAFRAQNNVVVEALQVDIVQLQGQMLESLVELAPDD